MIFYSTGTWGVGFVFRYHGSVFPKAFCWAFPNAAMAFLLHYFFHPENSEEIHMMSGVNMLFAAWSSVLGFLVVFRNNQAYGRFWEGATIVSQVRGNWFNAVSNLIAFCSRDPDMHQQVFQFQHLLVRLSSMLYCAALQQICDLRDDTLEIIDPRGMSPESLAYLQDSNDRCEIIIQWMQQMIVDNEKASVIDVAPPIMTRVFQELSNGIVSLNNVRKIKEIPFPFPYAQMITCMLFLQFCFTPIFAAYVVHTRTWAAIMCFLYSWSYACLIYIPNEIDQPFGSDANDLPLAEMQRDYNKSLLNLLDPLAQRPPSYHYDKQHMEVCIVESGFGLRSRIRKDSITSVSSVAGSLVGGSFRASSSLAGSFRQSRTSWSDGSSSPKGKKRLPSPETIKERGTGSPLFTSEASVTYPSHPSQESIVRQESPKGMALQREMILQEEMRHVQEEIRQRDPLNQLLCQPRQSSRNSHLKAAQRARAAPPELDKEESVDGFSLGEAVVDDSYGTDKSSRKVNGKARKGVDGPQANLKLESQFADLEKEAGELATPRNLGSPSQAVVKSHGQAFNDSPMTPHDLPMTRLAIPSTPPVTLR